MVRDLCQGGAGVALVVGRAGTGKTFALGMARHAWQHDGYRLLAAAPTGIASLSLQGEGFEDVATCNRLLGELDRGREQLDARTVLVIDEAGMVGSRKLTRLLEHAQQAEANCQELLATQGRLGPERLQVEDRQLAVGDRVVCGHNAIGELGVANGSRGTITALDPHARTLTIRLDGTDGREVTLPRSYLDGRGRGERNRRVDLAYATTGHRAQGLTRGRALVRLTGSEDVNWLYVQLSRARQETRLYAVVGPEPQGAGELDLPDREQPDGYLQLAQALSRAGGQTLAIDTPSSPDLGRLSMTELRAERDRLRHQLDQAPRDRARELARATAHRAQAEHDVAAHQQPAGRQRADMLGWLRRGDQPAGMPGGLAVATQQANRAHDREREVRQHQQRRDGWLEANAHLGPQYRQVVRTLAWQRRATGLAVEQERPGYALEALGPVPESIRGRRAWRQAAAEIEQYRRSYQLTDPDRALGPEPHDPAQRADHQRARTAITRVHTKQRTTDRTHERQPPSERPSQPRARQPRGRPDPERAAG